VQGRFVLEPRVLLIGIEIVIEIDFWQPLDFDSDFDFDGGRPSLRDPLEHPEIYHHGMIVIL